MPLLKTEAPDLEHVDNWINSGPINLEEGSHLLYFWNYSCNCCRERANLFQEIHENCSDIRVIGVHTPEFEFEKDGENLEKAVEKLEIGHHIAHDRRGAVLEDYSIAYSNQVIVVQEGSIVHQHNHRTDIEELEEKISEISEIEGSVEIPDINQAGEIPPQIFLGYSRAEGLNQEGNHPGEKNYDLPENRKRDEVYLAGVWSQKEHYIEASENSKLKFKSESSKVNLVVDTNGGLRDIEVLMDGGPVPEKDAGEDLRVEQNRSYIRTNHPDVYNLIDSDRRESEITLISDRKTRFYAFNFR